MASTAVAKKGVKQPEDHQAKVEKAKVEEVEGARIVTLNGHEYRIENEVFDDFELLDDLRAVQDSEDASRMPALLRRMLGNDGYKEAMNALRDPDTGRVGIEAGSLLVWDLFKALDPNS